MENKSFSELSDKEQSIVIALTEPMNRETLIEFLNLSSTYSQKLLAKLQTLGFIEQIPQPNGKAPLYRTVHFYATEVIYEMKAESLGTTNEYLIRWGDSLKNFIQIGTELAEHSKKYRIKPFFNHCMNTLYKLRSNSYRKDCNNPIDETQDTEIIRKLLEARIAQEEKFLRFAKAILAADPIWSDKPNTWKKISDTPVEDSERIKSNEFFSEFRTIQPKPKVQKEKIKEKVEEIEKKREPTEIELRNREIMKRKAEGKLEEIPVENNSNQEEGIFE